MLKYADFPEICLFKTTKRTELSFYMQFNCGNFIFTSPLSYSSIIYVAFGNTLTKAMILKQCSKQCSLIISWGACFKCRSLGLSLRDCHYMNSVDSSNIYIYPHPSLL